MQYKIDFYVIGIQLIWKVKNYSRLIKISKTTQNCVPSLKYQNMNRNDEIHVHMYTLDFSAFVGEISIPIEAVFGSEKSVLYKVIF